MGASAWTQPAREFVVKVVEMGLFSGDFCAAHFLLFLLAIPALIPGFNTIHATALLWLRPSKQIRAPLYSIKQRSMRRKIIFKCAAFSLVSPRRCAVLTLAPLRRYGILFALVFACLIALIVVPFILKSTLDLSLDGVNL